MPNMLPRTISLNLLSIWSPPPIPHPPSRGLRAHVRVVCVRAEGGEPSCLPSQGGALLWALPSQRGANWPLRPKVLRAEPTAPTGAPTPCQHAPMTPALLSHTIICFLPTVQLIDNLGWLTNWFVPLFFQRKIFFIRWQSHWKLWNSLLYIAKSSATALQSDLWGEWSLKSLYFSVHDFYHLFDLSCTSIYILFWWDELNGLSVPGSWKGYKCIFITVSLSNICTMGKDKVIWGHHLRLLENANHHLRLLENAIFLFNWSNN